MFIQYILPTRMNCTSISTAPEALHPALWRASQLARGSTRCVDTGHAPLTSQLPGGGWPVGTLVELLQQQPGIGEMRLLRPALQACAERRIVLLQPPHPPQALALAALGLPTSQLLWLRTQRSADALWAAEQVLRSGSCGALL
jgi:protein ImuA